MSRVKIRCGLCREAFPWELSEGYPTHCQCCGEFIGEMRAGPDGVAAPHVSTPQKRGHVDAIYRDMEEKSAVRAQLAAEASGLSASEVSHLKMTNMKDNLREGDTAFSNNLTGQAREMDRASQFGSQVGLAASAANRVGPEARSGTRFIQNRLRPMHQREYNAPVTDITSIPVGAKNA